ncbi:TRAP transporter small permease [Nocardioides houyundeii]|uniref:TRAP transporter small permease n=1 Tax=Nocardioides houyundeii TaxID=2045452 RepID=UPI000DF40362|nr:TRAP transporter small permease [Nocardioides houyundeii]
MSSVSQPRHAAGSPPEPGTDPARRTRLGRSADALWTGYAVLGGVGLMALLVVVVLDVVLRTVVGAGITGSNDLVASWFMTTIAFTGIALAQRTGGRIQVDFVMDAVPGRLRQAVDALVLVAVAVVGALFAWFGWLEALEQMEAGEYAPIGDLPLWPLRFMVPLGFAGFTLACLLSAIETLRADPSESPVSEVDRELAAISDDASAPIAPDTRSI